MRETLSDNRLISIPIARLAGHPGSPNRMSKRNFARLVRNIERTGHYEPLVVRRLGDGFEIINGRNRLMALEQLGYQTADAVVWDLDDDEADVLLCSLNRLKGSDVLAKKLDLLKRLSRGTEARELAKILPYTRSQIEKLNNLKVPAEPAKAGAESFAVPMVFFLSADQQQIVAEAMARLQKSGNEKTMAARNAAALTKMAECFIDKGRKDED